MEKRQIKSVQDEICEVMARLRFPKGEETMEQVESIKRFNFIARCPSPMAGGKPRLCGSVKRLYVLWSWVVSTRSGPAVARVPQEGKVYDT